MNILEKHLRDVISKTWNYAGKLQTERDHVLNAVLGLAGEAGEVADFHKKLYYHKSRSEHPDAAREELKLELGDCIFYWIKILDLYGFTVEEILEANRIKLTTRHPNKFKNE